MKGARRVREAARENGTAPTVVTASRADFHRPPQPLIAAFIDDQRAAGHAVESICRVLHEQGCQIAARTYRSWKQPGRAVAARTITDADVTNFAGISGDFNPLHTDEEFAKQTQFGGRIFHGPGVFAVATGLESRLGIKEGTAIAFLGMTWNLKGAVKIGDTILKYLSGSDMEAQYHETIYKMTIVDGLTGVNNKRFFLDAMDREIPRARRHQRPLSLVMMTWTTSRASTTRSATWPATSCSRSSPSW